MKTYCVKQKKQTECVPGSARYEPVKNGRMMLKCTCSECGRTKTKFVKNNSGGALFCCNWHSNLGNDVLSEVVNLHKRYKRSI